MYAAATVGEETTKNGAYWASTRIQPTLAIVVDVTYCTDYSGLSNPAEAGDVLLGGGPVLCNSPIVVKGLNDRMVECAEKIGYRHRERRPAAELYRCGPDSFLEPGSSHGISVGSAPQYAYGCRGGRHE